MEELQLLDGSSGASSAPTCRLVSERRISRHAVSELCCLPAARCLAVRSEDGSVALTAYDSATICPLPGIRSDAIVMAGDTARAPARLAVAVRANSPAQALAKVQGHRLSSGGTGDSDHRSTNPGIGSPSHPSSSSAMTSQAAATKLLVYAVAAGPGGTSHSVQPAHLLAKVMVHEPVSALAWVGDGILAAVPGGYKLIKSGNKVCTDFHIKHVQSSALKHVLPSE